jgi:succinylglutamic semialdehyde dehydrogenase
MTKLSFIHGKGQYIDGHWLKGHGLPLESINPSYGTLLWQGASATQQEISTASHAARQALFSWSSLDFQQRANYIQKFAAQVEKNRDQLAYLITLETGKPLWEAHTEVSSVIGKINISIKAYLERTSTKVTQTAETDQCLRFKAHGVVVVLGAFNFPAHLSNGHIVPALLAGNTVLYKPSEHNAMLAWQ